MSKRWKILVPDKGQVEELSKAAGVSQLLAWLLINRNINSADEAKKFLSPQIEDLLSGLDLQVFAQAGQMLLSAIQSGKKIGIHGDYDVDGITSAALLVEFLEAVGLKPEHYLPHRVDDGYGLSRSGVLDLAGKGVNFLIAVDCGISDYEAVDAAKNSGMQVLIVDHHRPPEKLPKADLILDPHLDQSIPYFRDLCSAGLVFFLLLVLRRMLRDAGFFRKLPEPNLRRSLDLVALGTIADVSLAQGLNRILLSYGIKEIQETSRFGLRVLKKRAGADEKELGYGQVAFLLAPRLNAAGRIDEADPGFELLLCKDPAAANKLADELERRNKLRQSIEEKIMEDAVKQVESKPDFRGRKSIVVAGLDWHPGVIGIVAQRLKERYYRPSIVISLSEGMGRGSGRGVNGLDLFESLTLCKEHLTEFGGHKLACGLNLKQEAIDPFREAFEAAVLKLASEDAFEEVLVCDAELPLFQISAELCSELDKLKPFGPGNSEPVMVAKSVLVIDSRPVKEKHLWLLLRERETTFQAMFFRAGIEPLKSGSLIDLAYTIERRVWKSEPQIRLIIKDLKKLN